MPYRILIVDDSKLARMSVAKILNTVQPDSIRAEAANAGEAMALAGKSAFDIALVDFNMPERDGLHLAADLIALHPNMALAVVSANHQKEVVDRAHAVGAAFLPKPLTEKSLRDFLVQADAQGKARAP